MLRHEIKSETISSLLPYYQFHSSITTLKHLQDKPILDWKYPYTKKDFISDKSLRKRSYTST